MERSASLYGDMPDARTIEVHFDAALVRILRDTNDFVLWKDRSMKRILQRYHFSKATAKSLARIRNQRGAYK
jgi:hypothetical protein